MRNNLWAKLEKTETDDPSRPWLSLIDHSADVAAVFEAMIRVPLVARRLANLARIKKLPNLWVDRLCVHVAFHDFGKANRGFQVRRDSTAPLVGHVGPGLALLYAQHLPQLTERLAQVLNFKTLAEWGACEAALRAVAAHHGRPITQQAIELKWCHELERLWASSPDDDPIAALAPLAAAVRDWFPTAFAVGGTPLPNAPSFWHAISGFVMLADWIGSDARAFPLYLVPSGNRMAEARAKAPALLAEYGFDPGPKRTALRPVSFTSISTHKPHAVQQAAGEVEGNVVILEAETGSGKTEAALYRFARLFAAGEVDGLYFALPTRVAAKSLEARVRSAVDRMFPSDNRPSVLLAIPGYARVDGVSSKALPEFRVLWDDCSTAGEKREWWAAEHPKRFLAGTIAVGTIDQALLGAIKVRHAHMRSSSLLRHLLVVDEVHASDVYMERLLTSLLDQHTRAGGHALLLSATLGSTARLRLLGDRTRQAIPLEEAEALPYPAISTSLEVTPRRHDGSQRFKAVALALEPRIADPAAVARMALAAAESGAKILVVRNLHRSAVATAQALFQVAPDHPTLFRCKGVPTLHHGRFAREDRELLDGLIENEMKDSRGRRGLVLIGTQTLEQSLDICADLLVTDLCPADVLLQRIGRLHRHAHNPRPVGFREPRVIVLCPTDLTPYLGKADFGLGGKHGPYRDLIVLEATRRLVEQHRVWQLPTMNRLLVERATHPDALEILTAELERLDGRWRKLRGEIDGSGIGDAQAANHACLAWGTRFDDDQFAFPENDALGTRLGASDLAITLPDGLRGPFGSAIQHISIPSYWLAGIDHNALVDPVIALNGHDRIEFTVQGKPFRYDRFGLQPR